MFHLTMRVAWHGSRWNGRVCPAPSSNAFCVALDRIREEKDDVAEDALAGRAWHELTQGELPPCKAEIRRIHERDGVDTSVQSPLCDHQEGGGDTRTLGANRCEGAALRNIRGPVRLDVAE